MSQQHMMYMKWRHNPHGVLLPKLCWNKWKLCHPWIVSLISSSSGGAHNTPNSSGTSTSLQRFSISPFGLICFLGWQTHQRRNCGQVRLVCGQPGHRLWGSFSTTWWVLGGRILFLWRRKVIYFWMASRITQGTLHYWDWRFQAMTWNKSLVLPLFFP